MQYAIDDAIASHASLVSFDFGSDIFCDASLSVKRARHLTIDALGATLWFTGSSGFLISESANVTLRNVTIDYEELPYLQMTAITNGRRTDSGFEVNLTTDRGSLDPIIFWGRFAHDPANEFVQGPQWWSPGLSGLYTAPPYDKAFSGFNVTAQMTRIRPGAFMFRSSMHSPGAKPPRKGDKLTVVVRKGITLHTHNSTRCRFEDVSIHSAPYMAVTEFDGVGGHVYERVTVGRRRGIASATDLCGRHSSPRVCLALVSSNADVFHSSGCRDGPRLTNVSFSYAMDDYFNVHSRAQVVATRLTDISLLVIDPRLSKDDAIADDSPWYC